MGLVGVVEVGIEVGFIVRIGVRGEVSFLVEVCGGSRVGIEFCCRVGGGDRSNAGFEVDMVFTNVVDLVVR